jgi:hypothetical protein
VPFRGAAQKRLVAVTSFGSLSNVQQSAAEQSFRDYVSKQLGLENRDDPRLVIRVSKAKDFLADKLTLAEMSNHFPPEETIFEELRQNN